MIRKPPLRTYQKKKTAQSLFINYPHSSLWESKTIPKRVSTGRKNRETAPSLNDETSIEDFSIGCDSTFDRLAKSARIPPPVQLDPQSSIDISSDVPILEDPSPVDPNSFIFPSRNEQQRRRVENRPKRRANQSRMVQDDAEVILKKRLKPDLVNLSVKKTRPVRNTRRKVAAKTTKAVAGSRRKKQDVVDRDSSPNDSKDGFISVPARGGQTGENYEENKKKKAKNSRRKKKVAIICISSCSDSDDVGEGAKVEEKTNAKQKPNLFGSVSTLMSKVGSLTETKNADGGEENKSCDAGGAEDTENKENLGSSVNTSRMSTVSNRTRSKLAMRNSPAVYYSENFRKYSALKQRDDDDDLNAESNSDSKKYKRILTKRQYERQNRCNLTRKSETDASSMLDRKNVSTRRCRSGDPQICKNDKITKPCSVVILKCKTNKDPVPSGKETTASYNHVQSSEDIFQSSVSNINQDTQNPIEIGSAESEKTGEAQSSRNNNSDSVPNVVDRKHKRNSKQKLKFLTCSTPIYPFVNIDDRSINCLSPIDGREGDENSQIHCNNVDVATGKEARAVPKVSTRRRSARKRLSISYEEDESFEPSNENVTERKNFERMKSPTSGIQESLKILKLDVGSSTNKQDADKLRLSQNKKVATSTDSNRSSVTSNRCNTNEFTGKSRDTCSQLTPVGIVSTRSGRQLKLSMTTEEKFFSDSNEPKILPATPKISDKCRDTGYEIIEDSVIEKQELQKHRINKIRGSRFTVFKSFVRKNIINDVKSTSIPFDNDSNETQSAVGISGERTSNDPTTSGELKTISSDTRSRFSTRDNGRESESNGSSVLDDEGSDASASVPDGQQIEHVTASDREVLQSIIESTKNLDSLNIKSHDEDSASLSDPENNDDSDSDWSTVSNEGNNEDISNVQRDIRNNSKTETSSCTENDDDEIVAGSSSTSSRESSDSTTSDVQEEENQKVKSFQLPLASSRDFDGDPCIEIEDEATAKTDIDPSLDSTEMGLRERLQLLSTRINTRKRRKTALRRVTENMMEVSEDKDDAIQITDHSKSTSSPEVGSANGTDSREHSEPEEPERYSRDESADSDLSEEISDPKPMINLQPIVLLERLKYLPRMSTSKTESLTAIHETSELITPGCSESSSPDVDGKEKRISEHCETSEAPDSPLDRCGKMESSKAERTPECEDRFEDSKFDLPEPEVAGRQSVFLKPGKDWARSLSVLNHIQDGTDLEILSSGKGKNWRKSVQTILGMQRERAVQSCLGKNEEDKDVQPYLRASTCAPIPEGTPCSKEQSLRAVSPSRFIPRMSMRVVPDNKKLSHIEDTSFLEVYGITASKSRKTLARISESKSGRRSLVYDDQAEDPGIETVETERTTARDVVLQRCCQEDYLLFTECFPPEYLEHCRKIGEGVYGEVFLYEQGKEKAVIKIIPIEGTALVNEERQKKFDEILSEIVIAKELHNLRFGEKYRTQGFVEVRNIKCIVGRYPEELIELWKAYDDDKGSENDCPSMFDENQLYVVLELGHGGQDLEAFIFPSAVQAHALFVQTALALAVAEQSLEFEHRDLHWGNILISNTKDTKIGFKLDNKEYFYPTRGMQVAIIDFTLSRMSYEGCCIFNDLALDPALFTAQGEYQFEIYRLMREKTGNDWQKFEPYTNVLWLHYTLDKMITALRYKKKNTKVHKEAILQLQDLKNIVLDYDSAFDFVINCDEITSLQCKSTMVQSTQIESEELNDRK